MNIKMRVRGDRDVSELAHRFEFAAAGLQGRLTAGLQQEAQSALAELRAAWLGIDVTSSRGGGSSSGLRARVASATGVKVTATGVTFEVDSSQVDGTYGKTLVYGLNGLGRWRHPVFGNELTWTQQYGREVFFRTLQGRGSRWEASLGRVVDDVAREIER